MVKLFGSVYNVHYNLEREILFVIKQYTDETISSMGLSKKALVLM
jgi:hypothetical protein